MEKIKLIASYVRLITCLLLHKNFGKLMYFFIGNYELLETFSDILNKVINSIINIRI